MWFYVEGLLLFYSNILVILQNALTLPEIFRLSAGYKLLTLRGGGFLIMPLFMHLFICTAKMTNTLDCNLQHSVEAECRSYREEETLKSPISYCLCTSVSKIRKDTFSNFLKKILCVGWSTMCHEFYLCVMQLGWTWNSLWGNEASLSDFMKQKLRTRAKVMTTDFRFLTRVTEQSWCC